MITLDNIIQFFIVILTIISLIFVTSALASQRMKGYIISVCTQPLWLYSTYVHGLYGMFFISCIYTIIWIRAILKNKT